MPTRVYISYEALHGLHRMSEQLGYRPDHNISRLIQHLAGVHASCIDSRPQFIRDLTQHPLDVQVWNSGAPKHGTTLGGLPITWLLTQAHTHDIRPLSHQAATQRGSARIRHPIPATRPTAPAIASAVLEALGLGYLRPTIVLAPPAKERKGASKQRRLTTRKLVGAA